MHAETADISSCKTTFGFTFESRAFEIRKTNKGCLVLCWHQWNTFWSSHTCSSFQQELVLVLEKVCANIFIWFCWNAALCSRWTGDAVASSIFCKRLSARCGEVGLAKAIRGTVSRQPAVVCWPMDVCITASGQSGSLLHCDPLYHSRPSIPGWLQRLDTSA